MLEPLLALLDESVKLRLARQVPLVRWLTPLPQCAHAERYTEALQQPLPLWRPQAHELLPLRPREYQHLSRVPSQWQPHQQHRVTERYVDRS